MKRTQGQVKTEDLKIGDVLVDKKGQVVPDCCSLNGGYAYRTGAGVIIKKLDFITGKFEEVLLSREEISEIFTMVSTKL